MSDATAMNLPVKRNNRHEKIHAFRQSPDSLLPDFWWIYAGTTAIIHNNTPGIWYFVDEARIAILPINGSMCYLVMDGSPRVKIIIN